MATTDRGVGQRADDAEEGMNMTTIMKKADRLMKTLCAAVVMVLAVTAAKLGAGEVIAMDYDRTAARVAQENVERNHVEECVTTGVSDLLQSFTGKADLIIANIIADIVIRLFDELDAHLAEGGHLLASGIIDERVADVTEAALSHGFAIDKVIEESGWAAMVISRGDAQ